MTNQIRDVAHGLLEKPPKLVEYAQELQKSALEVLDAVKKRAEEAVIKRQGKERK